MKRKPMRLAEQVKQAGIVGAGGAGFPTHVKMEARAEWFLANGAECEPLLQKDRELMVHFSEEIIEGLSLAGESVGAVKCRVGIKSKNRDAIESIAKATRGTSIEISEFGDFYPSGDEYEVVHQITGKLIPPAGIPLDVGAVVNNVETLYQIAQAHRGFPVTETFLTVNGAVQSPCTLKVPIGVSFREVIDLAGGATIDDYAVMDSGLMMGRLAGDLSRPVTKTTAGLIVLPASHELIERYQRPPEAQARIGKSACDQCSFCTELCPRYLLGYDVQPHAVMRSLGFSATGSDIWNKYAQLCCGCGICTLYACPESLYPREACLDGIASLRAAGQGKWEGPSQVRVHPMKEFRRVPMKLLIKKLGVSQYQVEAPFRDKVCSPESVSIPLKQHTGNPAVAVVTTGMPVEKGQLIGEIPDNQLGAHVHASIAGTVTEVSDCIRIERNGNG